LGKIDGIFPVAVNLINSDTKGQKERPGRGKQQITDFKGL